MEKSTEGVYWILENYFRAQKSPQLLNLLPSVWGDSFENYISECFKSGFGKDDYTANLKIKNEEKLDGLLTLEDIVCFIEIKYAHWTLKAKTTGEAEAMKVTLKQLLSVKKGLGQIIKGAVEANNDKWKPVFELKGRRILPIIIVGEAMPMDMLNWKFYEDFTKMEGIDFKKDNLLPFIILDAEEVEVLEAIAKNTDLRTVKDLLIEYSMIFSQRTDGGYVGGAMAFKNFLHSKSVEQPNNERLLSMFDNIANDARKKAFPGSKPFSRQKTNSRD